jgi:DNA-binding response OmpR family regulator
VRLLVAEDDPGLRAVLERGLGAAGYVVDAVADGDEALSFLRTYEYEAAILDWRMPRRSGLEVLADLRSRGSTVPVLLLTARDSPRDRVAGLDQGADDYLVKPFDFDELLARIRALQRRSPALLRPLLSIGDLTIDPAAREAATPKAQLSLTGIEYGILELLARRSPTVVERGSIALNVWAEEADGLGSNTIDVHVARLRSKLLGANVRIETVRGVGYRIVQA